MAKVSRISFVHRFVIPELGMLTALTMLLFVAVNHLHADPTTDIINKTTGNFDTAIRSGGEVTAILFTVIGLLVILCIGYGIWVWPKIEDRRIERATIELERAQSIASISEAARQAASDARVASENARASTTEARIVHNMAQEGTKHAAEMIEKLTALTARLENKIREIDDNERRQT